MHPQQIDYNDYDYDDQDDIDGDDIDSEEEYMYQMQQQQNIDTMRVEEIPVKEPMLNAVPKKSALKKKSSGSGSSTPSANSDAANRPLVVRQDNNCSLKWVRWSCDIFALSICTFLFALHIVYNTLRPYIYDIRTELRTNHETISHSIKFE